MLRLYSMDTEEIITLSQACELTQKSRLTIRRHILSKHLKAKKRQGIWTLNKKDVVSHFKISGDGGRPAPGVPVNVIDILKDQLTTKDKQIAELGERLREANIIIHKNQLALDAGDGVKDTKEIKRKFVLTDIMIVGAVVVLLYLSWLMTFG